LAQHLPASLQALERALPLDGQIGVVLNVNGPKGQLEVAQLAEMVELQLDHLPQIGFLEVAYGYRLDVPVQQGVQGADAFESGVQAGDEAGTVAGLGGHDSLSVAP